MTAKSGAALALFAMVASGCTGHPSPTPDTLQLEVMDGNPPEVVNMTAQDVARYPPVQQLVHQWEADGSPTTRHVYSTPYDYGQGHVLVRTIAANTTSGKINAAFVIIRYNGTLFDLSATTLDVLN